MTSAIERFKHRLLANYDHTAQERLADSEEISNMILVGGIKFSLGNIHELGTYTNDLQEQIDREREEWRATL
jgi:hypothetical protein